jgi:phosphoenolpyruvate synthase/pyruvate phosphate dikinase
VTYTAWFGEIRKDDIALVGGKGANLGELSHAGLPVPPGFVVTTGAYDAFVEAGGLKDEIIGLASQPRADDPAAFEAAEEKIRALFARGEIPDDVAAEIRIAYDRLTNANGRAVAVRSSATAEDLPGASFAGQQETYLNVRDAGALMEAIKACWASLWTLRAMAYRRRQNIEPATVSLAVVVQQMVPAEAAGIMFTTDPVGGWRDRTLINAAWGLGEAVVGGRVTPDTLVVDKASGRIVSRETADKEVMTVYTEGGAEERPVPEARRATERGSRSTTAHRRTSSGRWPTGSSSSSRRGRSPICRHRRLKTRVGNRPFPALPGGAGRWSRTYLSRSRRSLTSCMCARASSSRSTP